MISPPVALTAHLALLSSISFGGFPTVLPEWGITRRRWQSNGAAREGREATFSRALGTRPGRSPKAHPRLGVVLYDGVEPIDVAGTVAFYCPPQGQVKQQGWTEPCRNQALN